jgi:hypothetical protein
MDKKSKKKQEKKASSRRKNSSDKTEESSDESEEELKHLEGKNSELYNYVAEHLSEAPLPDPSILGVLQVRQYTGT